METMTFNQMHYADYREDEIAVTLRSSFGDCGGGSEVLVLESNQNHATVQDTEICPTLPASMGLGGGYVPIVVEQFVLELDTTIKIGGGAASRLEEQDKCR